MRDSLFLAPEPPHPPTEAMPPRPRSVTPPLYHHLVPAPEHAHLYIHAQEASLLRNQRALRLRCESRPLSLDGQEGVEGGRMIQWNDTKAGTEYWVDR